MMDDTLSRIHPGEICLKILQIRWQTSQVHRFVLFDLENLTMKPTFFGQYIVTDSEICHGKPSFRGTRILVADVLEQVANGLAWETIIEEWRGSISYEAIAEAVRLSRQAFLENAEKAVLEPVVA